MSLRLLAVFALTEFVLSLTPGPAVLLVISQGIRHGLRSSVSSAVGVLTGNAIYFALSAVGLGAILIASASLFEVIRWVGIAYLIFTGVWIVLRTFRRANADLEVSELKKEMNGRQAFFSGLLTQLLNPKAIVFFTALLPQFVSPQGNLALQFMILGITSLIVEFPVLVIYGFFADRSRAFISKGRYASWSDRIAGSCLIGVGVSLALARRS